MRTILNLGPAMGLAAFLTFFSPPPVQAQATTTSTTASAAIGGASAGNPPQVCIVSATGVVVPSVTASGTYFGVDQEAMQVMSAGSTSTCFNVRRGTLGTAVASHLSGATVWVGNAATSTGDSSRPFTGGPFITNPPFGSCVAANQFILPLILYGNSNQVGNGRIYTCTASGYWGQVSEFFVPVSACTFSPTTLTQTSSLTYVGSSPIYVLNSTTNAAAGTDTLVCSIGLPTNVTTNSGAILMDITVALGSQTTAPTSIGTATLGTINLPTPVATTQTASSNTLSTIGGTVTQVGPTTTVATVTTAGTFLTFKYTFSTEVRLSTDLRPLQFSLPILQSAAAIMTLNVPTVIVHYVTPSGVVGS